MGHENINVSILRVADLWEQECLPRDIWGLRPCQGPQYSTNTPCFNASVPQAPRHTHTQADRQIICTTSHTHSHTISISHSWEKNVLAAMSVFSSTHILPEVKCNQVYLLKHSFEVRVFILFITVSYPNVYNVVRL